MTLYKNLLNVSGLSHLEAAHFHDVRRDTINSWSSGRNPTPDGVILEIATLIQKMHTAINESMAAVAQQKQKPQTIELGLCSDDHEAQTLGWPCVSVHARVIGTIAAQLIALGHNVEIVPRGSTPSTAAAIEAHDT